MRARMRPQNFFAMPTRKGQEVMTKRFTAPQARRLSAVAIAAALAAFAGASGAQTRATAPAYPGYVTNTGGELVKNGFGGCVVSGQGQLRSSDCPQGVASAQASGSAAPVANPSAGRTSATAAPVSAASGATTGTPPRGMPGYAVASDGNVVRSGFGQCVRSGHWTPANAAEPCDRVATASVPPAPVAAPAPQLAPAPAPIAVAPPEPPRPVIQKVTLATDVLFDFNKAELKDSGKQKLDELVSQVKDANVDEIIAVGHADRIASEEYNQKLSEQRAEAVKEYLSQKVANANRVTAQGKGESQPVTGDDCKKMGPETGGNRKLVSCLQPDRRVEIEVLGTRQVAAGEAPAAGAGATTR
jgi:OOP family OmpA-OmpF porin